MKKRCFAVICAIFLLMVMQSSALAQSTRSTAFFATHSNFHTLFHSLEKGYLVGGYQYSGDVMSAMTEKDALVYLDSHFQVQWTLQDSKLTGGLWDQVEESACALYLGVEQKKSTWKPAIVKVNKIDGTITFMIEGDTFWEWNDFLITDNEELFCVGHQVLDANTSTGCLWKYDTNGRLLWEKIFSSDGFSTLSAMDLQQDGIVVLGLKEERSNVMKLDWNGLPPATDS